MKGRVPGDFRGFPGAPRAPGSPWGSPGVPRGWGEPGAPWGAHGSPGESDFSEKKNSKRKIMITCILDINHHLKNDLKVN